jgi:uncharacterized protein DUF1573
MPSSTSKADLLPKPNFRLAFDDHKVPEALRADFRDACKRAMQVWTVNPSPATGVPELKITFEPILATDPKTGAPANLALFFSSAPGGPQSKTNPTSPDLIFDEPRLTVALGLQRDNPQRQATAGDVFNDVRYAIGAYLGLGNHSIVNFVMNSSAQTDDARVLTLPERKAAIAALRLSNQLRTDVEKHLSIGISGRARSAVSPMKFVGDATQGDEVELPITLTNSGTADLVIDAIGDCACVVPESAPAVTPQGKGTLTVRIDTKNYSEPMDRTVMVFTNDPDAPTSIISVHLKISPRYRILLPDGTTWVFDQGGREGDAYITFPDGNDMKIVDGRIIGMEGARVTYVPWKGPLADPSTNEPPVMRHGYRAHISLPGTLPPGRSPVTLFFVTDDPVFSGLGETIYLQRGIVSLPERLFVGELSRKAKTFTMVLSRPGRPFKVLSVKSSLGFFGVKAEAGDKVGETKLVIAYNGEAPQGDIQGTISVQTDDPKQSVVKIPIAGSAL